MNEIINKTGCYFLKTTLLITLLHSSNSYSTVTIAKSEEPIIENLTPKKKPLPSSVIENNKVEQYQIEGYVNDQYVQIVVETTKNNVVVGQMIQNGKNESVSGEIIDGALHLYGKDGTHYTVMLAK